MCPGIALRRQPEHIDDLAMSGGSRVIDSHPDSQCATVQSFLYVSIDLHQFARRCFAMSGISTGQEVPRVLHDLHPHRNVPDAHSKVDERLAFPLRIPFVDIVRSGLQLERGGDPIARFELIIARLLAVLVQINKTWGNRQIRCINRLLSLQRFRGNRANLPAGDPHVPQRIKPRFGIHHSPVGDDHIIAFGSLACAASCGRHDRGGERYQCRCPRPPSTNYRV